MPGTFLTEFFFLRLFFIRIDILDQFYKISNTLPSKPKIRLQNVRALVLCQDHFGQKEGGMGGGGFDKQTY